MLCHLPSLIRTLKGVIKWVEALPYFCNMFSIISGSILLDNPLLWYPLPEDNKDLINARIFCFTQCFSLHYSVICKKRPKAQVYSFERMKGLFQIQVVCIMLLEVHVHVNRGLMDLKKTSSDVGMLFGNFRDYSIQIGNNKKRTPFGKRRVHSVSCRHNDDR